MTTINTTNQELVLTQKNRNITKWIRWAPNLDTGIAFASLLLMILAYYAATHWLISQVGAILVFGILTNLILNVLLPVWWIAYHRRQPLSELGITTERWLPSLLIGIGLAFLLAIRLWQVAVGINWLPHLLFNAACFWEPFFVYGWLQLRFERAFGTIPGIILAGLSLAAYHIGTYSPDGLIMLLFAGLLYAVVFRITSNLLIIWPLAFSLGSSMGTLMGGMQFTWNQLSTWSIILLLQLSIIGYTWWRQNRRQPSSRTST
jgi:hypothetical protein